jgi:hypothetical protein
MGKGELLTVNDDDGMRMWAVLNFYSIIFLETWPPMKYNKPVHVKHPSTAACHTVQETLISTWHYFGWRHLELSIL